jgi:hypothetical protein
VIVAIHGGSDKPEWACMEWRGVTNGYAFIVCPRGVGSANALYWTDPKSTLAAIDKATHALERDYAPYLADGDRTLVGFSIGATQTALIVRARPEFARIALSEGAYDTVDDPAFPSLTAKAGVKRVLFSCTTVGRCGSSYQGALARLQRAGVEARVNLAGNLGHGLYDVAIRSLRRDWPWLVAGAESWKGYTPPVEDDLPGKTITQTP